MPDTGQNQSYTTTFGEDQDYQPPTSQPAYADNGDGTTTDNRTGLMWAKDGNSAGCNNGSSSTWEQALSFCEGLTYANYSDWRLPNRRELMSIVDYGRISPAINMAYFTNTENYYYWTSTTYVPSVTYAWPVDFGSGSVGVGGTVNGTSKANTYYVRCVRSGP